ncbi:hypothetical protein ACH5RR_040826 [Cinchona calisaya]|uniref:Uncharacterized protein n=1 Tax=Cinchona calisaya TaxID=153742 RepID=A0ABD2XXV8_9GENT
MEIQFSVSHKEPELIAPAKPTPQEVKELSDIDDQKGLRFHIPMIVFYNSGPRMDGMDPARILRDAISKALVYYYPFAGRLIEGPGNKLMVDCTAEGVLFREATAEVTLEQLQRVMQPPFLHSKEFLLDVPGSTEILGSPLMLIQVTSLICGGIVFAVRENHALSDGIGLVQFLNAVSQISKDPLSVPSPLPVWQRKLLNARNPPHVTCVHNEYEVGKNTNDNTKTTLDDPENLVRKGFFFGSQEIKALKKSLPPNIGISSKFDLITAFVWRSRTISLQLDPDEVVSLTCAVNLRGKSYLNLPIGYYGNVYVSPAAVSKVEMLCNNSLGYAVELLKKAKAQVDEDFFKSAIDFNVMHGKPGYSTMLKNIFVADASRTGIDVIDFGWGKPIYGGTMDGGPYPNNIIYARVRNSQGEQGIVVPVCLPNAAMKKFEEEVEKIILEPLEECNKSEHARTISRIASML